jgi:predicted outer membrane protein
MRFSFRAAALAATITTAFGAGSTSAQQVPDTVAPDAGTRDAGARPAEGDNFVRRALKYGRIQAGLARLAAARSANPAVRDFARALEREQSARNERLAEIARERRATDDLDPVPNYSAQPVPFRIREFHRLRVLSGPAFDKQFLKFAIIGYANAIRGYETEARSRDSEAQKLAADALPDLRRRLGEAKKLLEEVEERR